MEKDIKGRAKKKEASRDYKLIFDTISGTYKVRKPDGEIADVEDVPEVMEQIAVAAEGFDGEMPDMGDLVQMAVKQIKENPDLIEKVVSSVSGPTEPDKEEFDVMKSLEGEKAPKEERPDQAKGRSLTKDAIQFAMKVAKDKGLMVKLAIVLGWLLLSGVVANIYVIYKLVSLIF